MYPKYKTRSWNKKWYTDEFLQGLKDTARTVMDGDLPVVEKYAPDAVSPIGIDPRMLGGPLGRNAKMMSHLPNFMLDHLKMTMSEKDLATFRASCDQISSAVCVREGVDLRDGTVPAADGYPIPIRIYRDDRCGPSSPCLYFMHGGGFIGGGIPPYDECWKVFVSKFHMVVVSVAYRLMPENPYPTPHEDCIAVLNYLHELAEELGIDPEKIFVAGDSAGGNLAQACSTRSKGSGRVRGQLLLYPTLNPFAVEDEYYKLDGKNFVYEPTQAKISRCVTKQLEMMVTGFQGGGMTGVDGPDPIINPYTFDAGGNPPTFISVGALDFLKNDAIAWAHKLQDAGVPVQVVVYNGMGHGYLNAMGVFPQSEDVVDEMGQFIQACI